MLNVVDVEATSWDGEPPAGEVSEIIEIGLTSVDLVAGERSGRRRRRAVAASVPRSR